MLVFLFTDIEGSSKLWEEHTEAMTPIIARHDEILRETVEDHGGRITKHTGDGITAIFEAGQPLACALEAQMRFAAEPWAEIDALPSEYTSLLERHVALHGELYSRVTLDLGLPKEMPTTPHLSWGDMPKPQWPLAQV